MLYIFDHYLVGVRDFVFPLSEEAWVVNFLLYNNKITAFFLQKKAYIITYKTFLALSISPSLAR
jgi:hypothetical protein